MTFHLDQIARFKSTPSAIDHDRFAEYYNKARPNQEIDNEKAYGSVDESIELVTITRRITGI